MNSFLMCVRCVHAVGPNFRSEYSTESCSAELPVYRIRDTLGQGALNSDRQLFSAYGNALRHARSHNIKTLAFSLISSGIFRGDRRLDSVTILSCHI